MVFALNLCPENLAQTAVIQAPVHLVKPNGVITGFGFGAANDVARGAALIQALIASDGGDVIRLGPGTFDVEDHELDLSVANSNGVSLKGSGQTVTIIESDHVASSGIFTIVIPGSNIVISDLSILGTAPGDDYQAPLGVHSPQGVATNVLIENVTLKADSDNLYISAAADISIQLVNCKLESKFDCVAVFTSLGSITIDLVDCTVSAIGPFQNGTRPTRAIYWLTGTLNMSGGSVHAAGGEAGDFAVFSVLTSAMEYRGVKITTDTSGSDLSTAAGGQISVDASTVYDGNKTSGTITKLNTYGQPPTAAVLSPAPNEISDETGAGRSTRKRFIHGILSPTASLTAGDGKLNLLIPSSLNGAIITDVYAGVDTPGTSGTTTVQISRLRGTRAVDVLSTELRIDSGEFSSSAAERPPIIDVDNRTVQADDRLRIDLDAVSSTPPRGLVVVIEFAL